MTLKQHQALKFELRKPKRKTVRSKASTRFLKSFRMIQMAFGTLAVLISPTSLIEVVPITKRWCEPTADSRISRSGPFGTRESRVLIIFAEVDAARQIIDFKRLINGHPRDQRPFGHPANENRFERTVLRVLGHWIHAPFWRSIQESPPLHGLASNDSSCAGPPAAEMSGNLKPWFIRNANRGLFETKPTWTGELPKLSGHRTKALLSFKTTASFVRSQGNDQSELISKR